MIMTKTMESIMRLIRMLMHVGEQQVHEFAGGEAACHDEVGAAAS